MDDRVREDFVQLFQVMSQAQTAAETADSGGVFVCTVTVAAAAALDTDLSCCLIDCLIHAFLNPRFKLRGVVVSGPHTRNGVSEPGMRMHGSAACGRGRWLVVIASFL